MRPIGPIGAVLLTAAGNNDTRLVLLCRHIQSRVSAEKVCRTKMHLVNLNRPETKLVGGDHHRTSG